MKEKILIVDDSKFMRAILKNILKQGGYTELKEANDGNEALNLIEKFSPDLLLLDIIMPQLDGLEVLKIVSGSASKPKIIMVTAIGEERMVKKAMDLGASDFVVKPFNAKQVLETLSRTIGK